MKVMKLWKLMNQNRIVKRKGILNVDF